MVSDIKSWNSGIPEQNGKTWLTGKTVTTTFLEHMRPLGTYISSKRVKITRKNIKHEVLEKITELE